MAISVQQVFEIAVFGDGSATSCTFNLGNAPFTTGGLFGALSMGAFGIGTPSAVQVISFEDHDGIPNPGGITVTNASLLVGALTLNFSGAIPHDNNPYFVLLSFIYNG